MTWNFDMSAAPRGRNETRVVTIKGEDVERTVFVSERIIAAAGDEKQTVTLSNWLPDQGRWNMFAKEHPPIAWMPWPAHPGEASNG